MAELSSELSLTFGSVQRPDYFFRDSHFAPSSLATSCTAFERVDWANASEINLYGLGDALYQLNSHAFRYVAPRVMSLVEFQPQITNTEVIDSFYMLPQLKGAHIYFMEFDLTQKRTFWNVLNRHLVQLETDDFPCFHFERNAAFENILGQDHTYKGEMT